MSKKPPLQWWVLPSLVTASLAMLGGLGTCAVKYAAYESLPTKVEAAVQKNQAQDENLTKLNTIADQNQKLLDKWDSIYQQQKAPNQSAPRPRGLREWDDEAQTMWCCPLENRNACFDQQQWKVCE